jgi:glycosyltransferase involved in cell wall biosynthesis
MSQAVALIVPCYNEAARLDRAAFLALASARPGLRLLFVDDGSTDATGEVLESLRAAHPRVSTLRLAANSGKAEAVRQGLVKALADGASTVGYCDADLSTPAGELVRLVDVMTSSTAQVVLASRVRLLGARIERLTHRHYLGRIFATVASLALRLPVYDTQCGAKLFRSSPVLAAAVAAPFRTRWIFDVELIARLRRGTREHAGVPVEGFLEVPLQAWRDVAGSKLRPASIVRAGFQLIGLGIALRFGRGASRPLSVETPEPPAALGGGMSNGG